MTMRQNVCALFFVIVRLGTGLTVSFFSSKKINEEMKMMHDNSLKVYKTSHLHVMHIYECINIIKTKEQTLLVKNNLNVFTGRAFNIFGFVRSVGP